MFCFYHIPLNEKLWFKKIMWRKSADALLYIWHFNDCRTKGGGARRLFTWSIIDFSIYYLYFQGTVHLWENEGSNNVAICQSNISDAFLRPGTSSVSPVMVAAGTSDDTVLYRDWCTNLLLVSKLVFVIDFAHNTNYTLNSHLKLCIICD